MRCFILIAVLLPTLAASPWTAPDLNPVTFHETPSNAPLIIVSNHHPAATLILLAPSSPSLQRAITELRTCIHLSTGADLPISDKLTDSPAIVIGDCAAAAQIGLHGDQLAPEGFAIKSAPNRLYVVGHPNSDALAWAIYEIAERYVGARWYFPGDLGRTVPNTDSISIPPVYLEDHPFFPRREIWPAVSDSWHGTGTDLAPLHAALRSGNSWPDNVAVHQPDWSGIEDYRKNRPEVFQLTSTGQRDFSMLCYSNPKTLQTYLENIELRLKGDPHANIGMNGDVITVSPNDAEIACNCPDCRKLWDPAAGHTGSASRIVAGFVSRLATEVQKRWPGKKVLYLAYLNYDDAPDGISFPSNVEVQICGLPGMAMYKEPSLLAHEQANVDKWLHLTGHKIQNWHYDCWPEDRTKAVYQYPHVVQAYYRANRDKTVGTFINGLTDHWPRQYISLYCWLKVLWSPDFNVDAAIDELCTRLYGPAADTMRELIKLQIDGWEKSRWPGGKLTAKGVYTISYPPGIRAWMKDLLAKAKAQTAADPILAGRFAYHAKPFEAFFREADQFERGVTTRLSIRRAEQDPVIDGKLDEPIWKRAAKVSMIQAYDTDWAGKKQPPQVKYPTTVQGVWTPDGVTFAFTMAEPDTAHLAKSRTGRDNSTLWWDDNVEIFFDPTGKDEGNFYHFIISASGTISDAKGKNYAWDARGIKTAVSINADNWTLEVYLPFSDFPEAARPVPGARINWTGNFGRHRLAKTDPGSVREYQRVNTTFAIPADNLSDFGSLEFRD